MLLAHVREAHRRHLGHAEQLCGLDAPVAARITPSSSTRIGIVEAERLDAVGDLADLPAQCVRALRGLDLRSGEGTDDDLEAIERWGNAGLIVHELLP